MIELIVVIAILGIVAAIAIPRLTGFKNMADERVCVANRKIVEKTYTDFLLENEIGDVGFNSFMLANFNEVCPSVGVIGYEDDPSGDEVPWL